MKKEKKGNLSCRKHFKGADFSFRSGMMRVQIPRGTPLGLRTAMREGKKRGAGTQFFFLLASMHPHTRTRRTRRDFSTIHHLYSAPAGELRSIPNHTAK